MKSRAARNYTVLRKPTTEIRMWDWVWVTAFIRARRYENQLVVALFQTDDGQYHVAVYSEDPAVEKRIRDLDDKVQFPEFDTLGEAEAYYNVAHIVVAMYL